VTIKGRTILYTGAAGGLGADTTLAFLRAGARVVAIDNDSAKSESLTRRVASEGLPGLTLRPLDLADLASLDGELRGLSHECGGFDVVINNAAIYPSKAFEDYDIEEYERVQRVNVGAAVACVRVALPHMKQTGWGRILNVASVTLYGGWAKLSPYVQSKGALVGLTRAWAREFGPYGITCNAVSPGAFPTDAEKIHPDPQGYARFVLEHQAIKRRGAPTDIAAALMFLASDEAGFVTGQTLNVDGGWIMR
jgi:3-oxoacyl-[acyl-carrier protein] reductase